MHAISFSEKGDYFVTVGVRLVKFWYIGSTDNANKVLCHNLEKERNVRSKQMIYVWLNLNQENLVHLIICNLVTFLFIMTVSDLLEQPCNKSDNAIKLVTSC